MYNTSYCRAVYFAGNQIIYDERFATFARRSIPSLPIGKSRENKLTNRHWGWQCRCSLSVFWTGRARDHVVPGDWHGDGAGWYKPASLSRNPIVLHSLETRLLSLREFDHQLQFWYDPRPVVTHGSLRPIFPFFATLPARTTSFYCAKFRRCSVLHIRIYRSITVDGIRRSVYQFLI